MLVDTRRLRAWGGTAVGSVGSFEVPEATAEGTMSEDMRPSAPDVTILVVTYNHAEFIERALDSVLAQRTRRSLEIVVADDASTDGNRERIEGWQARHPELVVRLLAPTANLGITRNYQRGFAAARGRFVAVLEGDDEWIADDKVERAVGVLERRPDLSMVAHRVLLFDDSSGEAMVIPETGFGTFLSEFSSEEIAAHNWFATFSACVYRAECLARVPAELFESRAYDWAINMAVTEFGPAGFLPQAMTLYRRHGGGAWSSQTRLDQARALRDAIPTYLEIFGSRLRAVLERRLVEADAEVRTLEASSESAPTRRLGKPVRAPIPRATGAAPRVSVVLTSYNNAPYVMETVESVLTQTMPDFELVIVDDGSADASWSRLADVTDPRVRMYRLEHNQGGATALNYGIQEARSALVAVVNSDDVWEPAKLERQLEVIDARPEVGAIFTAARLIGHSGESLSGQDVRALEEAFAQPNRSRAGWLRFFFEQGNALCHPSVLVRREFYERYGLYDNRLRQLPDFARWVTLVKHYSIELLEDAPLVRFRVQPNGGNTSHVSEEAVMRTRREHLAIMQGFFEDCPDDLIVEAFGDVLRQKSWLSSRERECVLTFLYLDIAAPFAREQGIRRLAARLGDPESARILAVRFGVTDLDLHRLGGGATDSPSAPPSAIGGKVESGAIRDFVSTYAPSRMLLGVLGRRLRRTSIQRWPAKILRQLRQPDSDQV